MTRRLAHAILRRYPDAWRQRYEVEVRALVDDLPMRWRDVAELFRHMLTERARELVASDDHPKRTATVLGLMNSLSGLFVIAAAAGTGLALRALTSPWSDATEIWIGVVFVVLLVALMRIQWRARIKPVPGTPYRLLVPPGTALVLLPLFFVFQAMYFAITLVGPTSSSQIPAWLPVALNALIWWGIATQLTSSLLPGQQLLQTFATLAGAESQLEMNQRWVEGCHEMIAKGVPSPLDDALAQVGRWTVERDSARERLRELGYRARFREATRTEPASPLN